MHGTGEAGTATLVGRPPPAFSPPSSVNSQQEASDFIEEPLGWVTRRRRGRGERRDSEPRSQTSSVFVGAGG